MGLFLSRLIIEDITDSVWKLHQPLVFFSDVLGRIEVPKDFYTDLASVPKVPFVYEAWGNRSHYEAVVHDYLYRIDSVPQATREEADDIFLEAMAARGKSLTVRKPMHWGVRLGGWTSYHKRKVADVLE